MQRFVPGFNPFFRLATASGLTTLIAASLTAASLVVSARPANAAQLQMLLPLGRTSYQTNELIDVSVVRSDAQPLAPGNLALTVTGEDGSKLAFTFPVAGGSPRSTENLHLNGWLLRPQKYTVAANSDGATAETAFTVYSHVRRSTYRTVHWGGPSGDAMLKEGWDGLGFNIVLNNNVIDQQQSILAGVDIMGNCLMGGGHQHGLVLTNDWSDPNVYIGAMQLGLDRAFMFRTMPNAIGAHLHDEPGLTWATHPHTGEFGPHDIKQQREAYQRAYGVEPIWYDQANTKDPAQYAQWEQVNDFKLGFMDAFWKASYEDLGRLKPGFMAITQSQYGWSALYDGYYFNVARSLPVISGHGGYNDYGLRNFNPSYFLEMALPRQTDKPTWYLPEWYGNMSADAFREEHNLSFITGIQGLSTPPGITGQSPAAPAVSEVNHLYQRLGTIFATPEATRQDVTILYSKSNQYYKKAQGQPNLSAMYLATKLAQYPVSVVLDEDIVDGTLASYHKACILAGITHLDAPVIAGLTDFVKEGGTVLETADCTVEIPGAVRLSIDPESAENKAVAEAQKITDAKAKGEAMAKLSTFRVWLDLAHPAAQMLRTALVKAGIQPPLRSSVETMATGKQVRGDIEYDFAVNFTPAPGDEADSGGYGTPAAASATITLADSRPVYNAVSGGAMPFKKSADGMSATLQFGPGQLYAFARTARPIGGVQVGTPTIDRDYTRDTDPLRVEFSANLMDDHNMLLAGSAPMQVKLTDPHGVVRYDLFRAAEKGVLNLDLPLAANDPAGKWTVSVTELLNNTSGTASFTFKPSSQCGALAGETPRAVYYGPDKENVFRFFRDHRSVAIVPGTSDYSVAAARRLADIMKPYNVNCTILSLDEATKAHPITDEEAFTWSSDTAAGKLDADARKKPEVVGYNLPGPTVLIGNAKDNPLIAYMQNKKVLPYVPTDDFPGANHGMVVWNTLTLGHDIESLALIGNDAAGVNEAVGTAFQFGTGIDPVTPFNFPATSNLSFDAPRLAAN